MKRILGLDLGSKTCGIAMSDLLGMIAHGVETYRFKENDYHAACAGRQTVSDRLSLSVSDGPLYPA